MNRAFSLKSTFAEMPLQLSVRAKLTSEIYRSGPSVRVGGGSRTLAPIYSTQLTLLGVDGGFEGGGRTLSSPGD